MAIERKKYIDFLLKQKDKDIEVTNLSYNTDIVNNGVTNETFEATKSEVQEHIKHAYKLLEEYIKEELAVEYYIWDIFRIHFGYISDTVIFRKDFGRTP